MTAADQTNWRELATDEEVMRFVDTALLLWAAIDAEAHDAREAHCGKEE